MKRFICIAAVSFALIVVGASSAQPQFQDIEGYTFIRGSSGSVVCLGRWVPSTDAGKPGVCEGQMVDVTQLTAISAKLSAERLDQLLLVLTSIDQKMADNNSQIERLIEATVNTQESIDHQAEQIDELLRDAISARFDALARRVLANDTFRKELEKLKADILADVKRSSSGQ
jgi:hypothetical protein